MRRTGTNVVAGSAPLPRGPFPPPRPRLLRPPRRGMICAPWPESVEGPVSGTEHPAGPAPWKVSSPMHGSEGAGARPIMSAAVLLSAGLLAAGCGGEPPSPEPREDAKSASPATEEPPSPAPTEEAAAEEEKEQEGVLGFWWSVRNSSDSPAVVSIQFSEEGKVSMLGDPGLESVEK